MHQNKILNIFYLFVVFLLIYNYPIIQIADKHKFIFGIPILYFFLFVVWAINIAAIIYISTKLLKEQTK